MFRVNHKELARLRHGGGAGAIRSKTISTHSEESLTATCILSVINWEGGGEGLGRWGGVEGERVYAINKGLDLGEGE